MVEIDKDSLIKIILGKDLSGFKQLFPDKHKITKYRDEQTGDNIFHLLAKNADCDFTKTVYENYTALETFFFPIKELLLTKNNQGEFPATIHAQTENKKVSINEAIKRRKASENHIFLKRETKKYYYETYQSSALISVGNRFRYGNPFIEKVIFNDDSDKISHTKFLTYPSISLVKRLDDVKTNEKGLSIKSDSTVYVNSINHAKYMQAGKEIDGYNYGEFLSINDVPLNASPIKSIEETYPFLHKDFKDHICALNLLANEIKSGMNDDIMLPLHQYFISKGGTFIIEDKNEKYRKSNAKENDAVSYGSSIIAISEGTSTILTDMAYMTLINASITNTPEKMKMTVSHELAHACDGGFSSSDLFKQFVELKSKNTYGYAKHTIENIKESYKNSALYPEMLANIMESPMKSDELTNSMCRLFSTYVKSATLLERTMAKSIIDEKSSNISSINSEGKMIDRINAITCSINEYLSENSRTYNNCDRINDEKILEKQLNDGFSKDDIVNSFNEISSEIKDADIIKMNAILSRELKNLSEKEFSKLQIFKIGLITTAMKINGFVPKFNNRYKIPILNAESYKYVKDGRYNFAGLTQENRDLIKDAVKIKSMVDAVTGKTKNYANGNLCTKIIDEKSFKNTNIPMPISKGKEI